MTGVAVEDKISFMKLWYDIVVGKRQGAADRLGRRISRPLVGTTSHGSHEHGQRIGAGEYAKKRDPDNFLAPGQLPLDPHKARFGPALETISCRSDPADEKRQCPASEACRMFAAKETHFIFFQG